MSSSDVIQEENVFCFSLRVFHDMMLAPDASTGSKYAGMHHTTPLFTLSLH